MQVAKKQFDYVNPRNREVQIEMEQAATAHLSAINALVDTTQYAQPDFSAEAFPVEASGGRSIDFIVRRLCVMRLYQHSHRRQTSL